MRRLFIVLLFTLLVVPFAASAQDQPLGWPLNADTYLDVTDLGIRFFYPVGWFYGTDNQGGIAIADNQANLNAQIDGDENTQLTGLSILIRGIPLTAFTDLGDKPTLDAIADYLVRVGGITETRRTETPIMTRRSISVFGITGNNRAGIASMWVQDGNLMVASLGAPDVLTLNGLASTWDKTIGLIAPLDAQPLDVNLLIDESSHFTINFPAGWTPDPNKSSVVYEQPEEVGQGVVNIKGNVFTFTDAALRDLSLPDDATLNDAVVNVKAIFDLDNTATSEDFVLMGLPAVTLRGAPNASSGGAGHEVIVTVGLIGERVYVLVMVTPSKDAADAIMPTWIAMLMSVKST